MRRLVNRLVAAIASCNPLLGERKREKYAPLVAVLVTGFAFVLQAAGVEAVSVVELEKATYVLVALTAYVMRHYEPADGF